MMVLNPGCTIESLRISIFFKKRPGLTSIDADLLFWGKARAVGQFKNYSGDFNMQPGPRISACVWGWGGVGVMMERHQGERATDRTSVLHLWSIREGVSVSGSNLHRSAGQEEEIKIKGKQKGSMSHVQVPRGRDNSDPNHYLFKLL